MLVALFLPRSASLRCPVKPARVPSCRHRLSGTQHFWTIAHWFSPRTWIIYYGVALHNPTCIKYTNPHNRARCWHTRSITERFGGHTNTARGEGVFNEKLSDSLIWYLWCGWAWAQYFDPCVFSFISFLL